MKKLTRTLTKRDGNIALNSTMEINLGTRSIQSKKIYNRKKLTKLDY